LSYQRNDGVSAPKDVINNGRVSRGPTCNSKWLGSCYINRNIITKTIRSLHAMAFPYC